MIQVIYTAKPYLNNFSIVKRLNYMKTTFDFNQVFSSVIRTENYTTNNVIKSPTKSLIVFSLELVIEKDDNCVLIFSSVSYFLLSAKIGFLTSKCQSKSWKNNFGKSYIHYTDCFSSLAKSCLSGFMFFVT